MLVDIDIYGDDPFTAMISGTGRHDITEIHTGMYVIKHFSFNHTLKANGYNLSSNYQYPVIVENYGNPQPQGVCDYPEQLIEKFPIISDSERSFVISFTEIRKDEQSDCGGWRWHKWGQYIGDKKPTTEYLYDEPEIDVVWVYHIYEIPSPPCGDAETDRERAIDQARYVQFLRNYS